MEVLGVPTVATMPTPACDMASMFPEPACTGPDGSSPGAASCSLGSSTPDVAAQQQQHAIHLAHEQQQAHADAAEQRTHHLLKHCLSQSQRGSALQHFHTGDPREAAKEIARMGQRELQAKFREVYGSATKSNNNSWLRRKLYEAVGVAPLKANTKGKARKSAASGQRKSGGAKDAAKARSPKVAAPPAKAKHADPAPGSSPAPLCGAVSILDLHHHSGLLSADTSDSEDGSASHGNFPASMGSSPDSPRSPLGHGLAPFHTTSSSVGTVPPRCAPQLSLPLPSGPAPAGFVPMGGCGLPPEPQSPLAAGLHWADGLVAQAQQGSFAAPDGSLQLEAPSSLAGPAFPGPMDLAQDAAQLWDGGEGQAWYYGGGVDLGALGMPRDTAPALPALGLGLGMPMDADAPATGCCCPDDDDIPLLTLDLGAIDVSI